jgi:hypothetical protein
MDSSLFNLIQKKVTIFFQVASFGIYIIGFFTSLLSTIQRTIDNIYLKK